MVKFLSLLFKGLLAAWVAALVVLFMAHFWGNWIIILRVAFISFVVYAIYRYEKVSVPHNWRFQRMEGVHDVVIILVAMVVCAVLFWFLGWVNSWFFVDVLGWRNHPLELVILQGILVLLIMASGVSFVCGAIGLIVTIHSSKCLIDREGIKQIMQGIAAVSISIATFVAILYFCLPLV